MHGVRPGRNDLGHSLHGRARTDGQVELVLEAKAYKFFTKLITPLTKGMIKKFIEGGMHAVKAHCEK